MSARMMYVYVAGPLSDMPPQYLANVAAMTAISRTLIELEFCPINPAADMLEGLMAAAPLTLEQYQRRSMDLLRLLGALQGQSADMLERGRAAVFVVATLHRNGSVSGGVAAEIVEAENLGIPVVHSLGELLALRDEG